MGYSGSCSAAEGFHARRGPVAAECGAYCRKAASIDGCKQIRDQRRAGPEAMPSAFMRNARRRSCSGLGGG
ncbi:MAG: hypothetical protein WAT70_13550, partial [Rhizobiaceae bacterium]